MSLRVEFLAGADADLQEIFSRFEDHRDGFGIQFRTAVDAYLTRIDLRQDEERILRRLQT